MCKAFKLVGLQMRSWRSNPLTWLSFLLGLNFMFSPAIAYVRFAHALSQRVQIFEPFILAGSNKNTFMYIFLGVLMLLSDAPFVNDLSQNVLFRTSRRQWAGGYLFYIALCCLIYYTALLAFSILVACANGYTGNLWSYPMAQLAAGASVDSGLSFANLAFLQRFSPWQSALLTLFLQASYAFVFGAAMFILNMRFNRAVGTAIVLFLHAAGNNIILESYAANPFLSLMVHAMPAYHNVSGDTLSPYPALWMSCALWAALSGLAVWATLWRCKRFDFVTPNKNI